MSKNAIKVLIIGLDGATWDIIDGLVKNNELPTFKKLIYDGVKAKLYSTQPNLTPIAWSSFLTGKNPGNHGIYDFFKYENKKATPVNSKMLKGDLWEVLGKRGKKIISLDVALTYPPKKVNGIVVSGFPVVDLDSNFIYPSRIKNKLDIHLMNKLGHKYYPTPGDFSGNIKTLKGFIKSHYDFTDQACETSKYLISNYNWDVSMIYFNITDALPHKFWKYFDKNHADYKKSKEYKNVVHDCYKYIDKKIDEILSQIEKDNTIILIASDHGFGPVEKIIYPNNVLIKLNLLKFRKGIDTKLKYQTFKMGFTLDKIYGIFSNFLQKIIRKSKGGTRSSKIIGLKNKLLLSFNDIDFSKTKAFCRGSGIFINSKDNKEKKNIEKFITNELLKIKDLQTGKRVIKEILPKKKIYEGNYSESAPDLLIVPNNKYIIPNQFEFASNRIINKSYNWSGGHRPQGIFLIAGPGVRKNKEIGDASIVDVFPTLLHIFSVSVPNNVDGKILHEVFNKNSSLTKK